MAALRWRAPDESTVRWGRWCSWLISYKCGGGSLKLSRCAKDLKKRKIERVKSIYGFLLNGFCVLWISHTKVGAYWLAQLHHISVDRLLFFFFVSWAFILSLAAVALAAANYNFHLTANLIQSKCKCIPLHTYALPIRNYMYQFFRGFRFCVASERFVLLAT